MDGFDKGIAHLVEQVTERTRSSPMTQTHARARRDHDLNNVQNLKFTLAPTDQPDAVPAKSRIHEDCVAESVPAVSSQGGGHDGEERVSRKLSTVIGGGAFEIAGSLKSPEVLVVDSKRDLVVVILGLQPVLERQVLNAVSYELTHCRPLDRQQDTAPR